LLPLAIFLPVIIDAALFLLSKRVGQVLDARPASWLVCAGCWRHVRLAVGHWRHVDRLFALPAAIAVATGTAEGQKAAIIWNIFGLADFAVTLTLGLITFPGQFQLIVPDAPSIGAACYRAVLTPAFVVPSSILLHALSLRQPYRRGRAQAARHQTPPRHVGTENSGGDVGRGCPRPSW
jgi:hypothetical protein